MTTAPSAREAILQACFELFERRGVRASVVDDLVEAAGIAKATFYSCVHSKEEVALAYLDHLYLIWVEALEAGVAARGEGPESLLGIFDAVEQLCGETGGKPCASMVRVLAEFGTEEPIGKASVHYSERLTARIGMLAEAAGLGEAAGFARDCRLLIDGAILSEAAGNSRSIEDARAMAETLIKHYGLRQGTQGAPA
ncbi:TetR/AcrR family transcriptional regulator [Sinomonas gamaensis]|uniref:TetR/AcrR family transcriptional regulator n=1 Tax=Sinomonas gamaensis TaxID=2565624 RepID=UPI001109F9B0|nr:TetR/AcrR family transcriptional regulator [Sinomonas gamaensis]